MLYLEFGENSGFWSWSCRYLDCVVFGRVVVMSSFFWVLFWFVLFLFYVRFF